MIWHLALITLLALGALSIWRMGGIGSILMAGALYLFLQASSRYFLNPYYKDGGNGVWLSDGLIWMVWAVLAALVVGGLIKTLRVLLTRQS